MAQSRSEFQIYESPGKFRFLIMAREFRMKPLYGLGKERLDKVRKLMDLGLDWQLHRCWLKETAAILNTTSPGLEG